MKRAMFPTLVASMLMRRAADPLGMISRTTCHKVPGSHLYKAETPPEAV